jgi:hypothetical protein
MEPITNRKASGVTQFSIKNIVGHSVNISVDMKTKCVGQFFSGEIMLVRGMAAMCS